MEPVKLIYAGVPYSYAVPNKTGQEVRDLIVDKLNEPTKNYGPLLSVKSESNESVSLLLTQGVPLVVLD